MSSATTLVGLSLPFGTTDVGVPPPPLGAVSPSRRPFVNPRGPWSALTWSAVQTPGRTSPVPAATTLVGPSSPTGAQTPELPSSCGRRFTSKPEEDLPQ